MPGRTVPPSPARPALVLFTAAERNLIRREFLSRFGQDPSIADGIMLRTWRGGPNAGQPKLPPPVQSLLARGLVALHTGGRWSTAQFTPAGLVALRELAQDRRALDPVRYAHLRRELGLEAGADTAAAVGEPAASTSGTKPD